MEQLRISAKDLGHLALPGFCPRCFWITRHARKLPFQIFPGIFNSIDSYSKKISTQYFDAHQELVRWFREEGLSGEPVKVPHHTKFHTVDAESDVLLTGMPDEILRLADGSFAILDYKTARFTGGQDALMPIYQVQLNGYAYIGERAGFNPVTRLVLVYYEPVTDVSAGEIDGLITKDGFYLGFSAKLLEVSLHPETISPLLRKAREIFDLPKAPEGCADCADCEAIERLIALLAV